MKQTVHDKIRFFYSFLQSPKRIGSVIPSSSYLARGMFRSVDFSHINSIVELGAGTGVFTKIIAEKLQPSAKGLVFEQNNKMRNRLENTYPNLNFYSNATELTDVVKTLEEKAVDVVISSLPFANFSQEIRMQIAHDIYKVLKPNGMLVAFQYSRQMKAVFESLFSNVSITFVPFNIPPAFVFTCIKVHQSFKKKAVEENRLW
ncbi:methyltransferase domain-containing protein [Shimazuella sp. AN120528]|uniref:class I SAM-dependent methyltransferase n=1 Tax=Shimazuella soli TaxID=1892854 RepID=UPI001F110A61|nr:methyltransferase domain-containing protein [Shimazuella soli]MCH5584119.1 methyltransferase domain-containing protein [Shimazuella soli]